MARGIKSGTVLCVSALILAIAVLLSTAANAQQYESVPILKGDPDAVDNPTISEVQSTPLGYVIVGLGFGQDPASIKVLEDGVAIAESAIAGVSTQRISVLSVPNQPTAITVEVGGTQSAAVDFNYVKPVEPNAPEMPTDDETLSAEPAAESAPAQTPPSTETQAVTADESVDAETVASTTEPMGSDDSSTVAASSEGAVSNDLEREVMVLRRRMESLEQEIYELKKALDTRSE